MTNTMTDEMAKLVRCCGPRPENTGVRAEEGGRWMCSGSACGAWLKVQGPNTPPGGMPRGSKPTEFGYCGFRGR